MTVTPIRDEGQTPRVPTGKLLGIVDTPAETQQIAEALAAAGFDKIQSLSGTDGVNLLERVHTFFFSDMEERVLNRHIEELKAGHTVIIIETPSEKVEEATQIASKHGARRLVYFGALAVTWLTP